MTKGRNTTVIGVRLKDDLYQVIVTQAQLRKVSKSDWLRAFLRNQFDGYKGRVLLPVTWEGETSLYVGTPDPNQPCPCGDRWSDHTPKKYKHCCGK